MYRTLLSGCSRDTGRCPSVRDHKLRACKVDTGVRGAGVNLNSTLWWVQMAPTNMWWAGEPAMEEPQCGGEGGVFLSQKVRPRRACRWVWVLSGWGPRAEAGLPLQEPWKEERSSRWVTEGSADSRRAGSPQRGHFLLLLLMLLKGLKKAIKE